MFYGGVFQHNPPVYKAGTLGGLHYAIHNNKAVLLAAILRAGCRLGSPPCVGFGHAHDSRSRHNGKTFAVIAGPVKSLFVVQRHQQMPSLRFPYAANTTGTKRTFSGLVAFIFPDALCRGFKGFLCLCIFRFTQHSLLKKANRS